MKQAFRYFFLSFTLLSVFIGIIYSQSGSCNSEISAFTNSKYQFSSVSFVHVQYVTEVEGLT